MNNSETIAVIDAGGSATDIAVFNRGNPAKTYTTSGINPQSMDAEILYKSIIDLSKITTLKKADNIFFYGAGCGSGEQAEKMEKLLGEQFPDVQLQVNSDIVGAGRAVLQNRKGIACILGTGSACAQMQNGLIEKYLPSGGYLIGDEGSGAYIGKQFVRSILNNSASEKLTQAFHDFTNLNNAQIIPYFYQGNAQQKFAEVFRFLHKYKTDNFVKELFSRSVSEFFKLQVMPYLELGKAPQLIGFCGSVAWYLQDFLNTIAQKHSLKITQFMAKPINGIVNYHQTVK